MAKLTNRDCIKEIAQGNDFVSGNGTISGQWYIAPPRTGKMSNDIREQFTALFWSKRGPHCFYVVHSYDTPIMAISANKRVIWDNPERYSVTTSKHHGLIRMGISELSRGY